MHVQKLTMKTLQAETVGEVVHVLRVRLGLEQGALARKCGWGEASVVSRIEKGRINPKRSTLLKLADNLADPAVTGTSAEVGAQLFLVAGILPTRLEIGDLGARIPDIDLLPQPTIVMDFGWYLWRANERLQEGLGLPDGHVGRNYLEILFEDGGLVRKHLGDLWRSVASWVVSDFRRDTAGRRSQHWFSELLATLRTLPDFEKLWKSAVPPDENVFGWSQATVHGGTIGAFRARLAADPRLIVGRILPVDLRGRDVMLQYGALLP
jgi:transcriptional regulator with XRE-family HTH domain